MADTTDENGAPLIDPSVNVKALNEAATRRQDDLRQATAALYDAKIAHQKEISELRARHEEKMREQSERHHDIARHTARHGLIWINE